MKSTENVRTIVETIGRPGTGQSNKYKSTGSLHELGLDNYPNPEYPASARSAIKTVTVAKTSALRESAHKAANLLR